MNNVADVLVMGLGAMGSAATYQLAKRGVKVIGIDQFTPPHSYGSSHGDTRITRQAIGEGAQYTPLSLRSYEIWRELEQQTGKKLLEITGGLIISSMNRTGVMHVEKFYDNTIAAAAQFGISHRQLTASEIRQQFPQFQVQDNEIGYYEPMAGFLRPEECIRAQLQLAVRYGATIKYQEKIIGFSEQHGLVRVETETGKYQAKKLIVAAGAWLPLFIPAAYAQFFRIQRQVLYWFDIKENFNQLKLTNFPIFIWELQGQNQSIYGFPAIDGPKGGLKIASEQYDTTTHPDRVDRVVSQAEINAMYRQFVAPYFPQLGPHCVKAVSCLYTVTPDCHFVIDHHPQHPSVILASACSGHGFKHSAAVGEILADLATQGKTNLNISSFSFKRFTNVT